MIQWERGRGECMNILLIHTVLFRKTINSTTLFYYDISRYWKLNQYSAVLVYHKKFQLWTKVLPGQEGVCWVEASVCLHHSRRQEQFFRATCGCICTWKPVSKIWISSVMLVSFSSHQKVATDRITLGQNIDAHGLKIQGRGYLMFFAKIPRGSRLSGKISSGVPLFRVLLHFY